MLPRDEFLKYLREGLVHLYEPRRLSRSPLASLFGVAGRFDSASALQRILVDAIRSLEPPDDEPTHSHAWDVYEPLFYRYVEQLSQAEVADQLRLSVRHLRRKERDAQEVLADLLWRKFNLDQAPTSDGREEPGSASDADRTGMSEELAWLKESAQSTDLDEALPGVVDLAQRLAEEHRVQLEVAVAGFLPKVPADPVALRQCLLSLLSVAIPQAARGQVTFSARLSGWEVEFRIHCPAYPAGPRTPLGDETASLNMAHHLAALCKGRLRLAADATAFDATLSVPAIERLPVLAVDDNADTLQLLQRYTLGTRYRLVATRDPAQVFDLVREHSPQAIVLDVMMPNLDGWEVLGRLRQHPATADLPVIVCTILAQKEMARLLGASAFLKKPVTRQAFLAALDQQTAPMETGSR